MLTLVFLPLVLLGQTSEKGIKENPVLPALYHPLTHGPTLSEISMAVAVSPSQSAAPGTVQIPAPSDYSGQLLISLAVHTHPESALRSWKLVKRSDKFNSVIEVKLAPASKVKVSYNAFVLCPSEPVYRTMSKVHAPWLAHTSCVQASDATIRSAAARLKAGSEDQDAYVRQVLQWVARIPSTNPSTTTACDAKTALKYGGPSIARANLCAAMLRSQQIPARVVAVMPTTGPSPISQHWLTEYWTDDGNWSFIDPTIGLIKPGRNSAIVLSISSTTDENRAFEPIHMRGSLGGIPYLAAAEVGPEYTCESRMPLVNANEIHLLKTFPHQSEARVMTAGYRRSLKVLEAAGHGIPMALDRQDILNVIAKGPGQLALYLDGRLPDPRG